MSKIDYLVLNKDKLYSSAQDSMQWRESAKEMVRSSLSDIFWLGTHETKRLIRGLFWWSYALIKSIGDS